VGVKFEKKIMEVEIHMIEQEIEEKIQKP